jgi:hypothetical protein|tara:strand:- start:511 stop:654 length:144 start_codon:yes stop_codon:yes gene_type:complete
MAQITHILESSHGTRHSEAGMFQNLAVSDFTHGGLSLRILEDWAKEK